MFGYVIMKQSTLKKLIEQNQETAYRAGYNSFVLTKEMVKHVTPAAPVIQAGQILWLDEQRKGELK